LMRVVCEEFSNRGGITVGVIPIEDEFIDETHPRHNPYNTIVIKTGQTLQSRSIPLVRSSDSFVILGGGAGTIIEAYLAYLYRIPLIIVTDTGYPSDQLRQTHPDGHFDQRKLTTATYTSDPEQAADEAVEKARRHRKKL
ncbi:MAG: TIGR00725 family protein, partial [Anaerolineae bacterium]|nr:TIGR00725 family protein [Anaerolineae bacterium]